MKRLERAEKLIRSFQRVYPHAHCELNFSNPLQLLVATILSAQCTDKRVNMVTPALFKKYKSARDFARAPQKKLEAEIRTTGFFSEQSEKPARRGGGHRGKAQRQCAADNG